MADEIESRVIGALTARASESPSLDYKLAMYEATEGGRKEFAKDIAGFANRAGGLLIVGVKEKSGKPTEVAGLDPDSTDKSILWLESVARTGVTPHLRGVTPRVVIFEDKTLIAVDVPRGLDQPYEVPAAGQRFFVRDEMSTRAMSREELRFAVLQSADLSTRIQAFCEERWQELCGPLEGHRLLSAEQGGCQLIVFPIFEQSFSYRLDLPTVHNLYPHRMSFSLREGASARASIDGLEYRLSPLRDGKFHGLVRLYRHGAVLVADGYVMNPYRLEGREAPYPGTLLMTAVLGSIKGNVSLSHKVTGATTFVVDFRIAAKPNHPIAFYSQVYESMTADREDLVFDPITIRIEDDWEAQLPNTCRPLLDQIWQAFGYVECGYFESTGVYSPPR